MTTKSYRLSPLARNDLADIWLYTMTTWSQVQADQYHRELISTIEALAEGRKQGRASATSEGYLKRRCQSHVIWYRDLPDRLDIIRILHSAQDAERHLHD
jgi:toxin ParE1/3/4